MDEIRLEILPHHIEQAKAEQAKFDAQKTHDKFTCNTNYKTIDLKTTFSDVMWIQQEKFDYYIYAQINKNQTLLKIKGWMTKQEITESKYNGNAKVVNRGNRKDYVFQPFFMNSIKSFFEMYGGA